MGDDLAAVLEENARVRNELVRVTHLWEEAHIVAARLAALEQAARDLANSFAMARSNDEWFMAALEVVRVVRELDTPPVERSADD